MLPSCPIDSRCYLPAASAIYYLMRGDECLYVGKSVNLRNRWGYHEKLKEVDGREGLRLAWEPTPESRLDAVERTMIAVLKPQYNYNLVPRPPVAPLALLPSSGMADTEVKLTTSQVAKRLSVGQSTVNLWCRKGDVFPNAERIETPQGGYWVIPESDLVGFQPPKMGRPPKARAEASKATKKSGKK